MVEAHIRDQTDVLIPPGMNSIFRDVYVVRRHVHLITLQKFYHVFIYFFGSSGRGRLILQPFNLKLECLLPMVYTAGQHGSMLGAAVSKFNIQLSPKHQEKGEKITDDVTHPDRLVRKPSDSSAQGPLPCDLDVNSSDPLLQMVCSTISPLH